MVAGLGNGAAHAHRPVALALRIHFHFRSLWLFCFFAQSAVRSPSNQWFILLTRLSAPLSRADGRRD